MNEELLKKLGMTKELELIKGNRCPLCGEKINPADFKTNLSRREFQISKTCQKCQDEIFGR